LSYTQKMESPLDFKHYKEYFLKRIENSKPKAGAKLRIAQAMGCHSSYLTLVFKGEAEISLEQAQRLNEYWSHTEIESECFILLVLKSRAGSKNLEKNFDRQLSRLLEKSQGVSPRISDSNNLSIDQQASYFSKWYHGAIHVMSAHKNGVDSEYASKKLKISQKNAKESLSLLESLGLVKKKESSYFFTGVSMHLPKSSPISYKHHANWRLRSIQANEEESSDESIFYTSIGVVSNEDYLKIRKKIFEYIKEVRQIIDPSPSEELFCFQVDLFKI